jgi:hypothetical protein
MTSTKNERICTDDGCSLPHHAHGKCRRHYEAGNEGRNARRRERYAERMASDPDFVKREDERKADWYDSPPWLKRHERQLKSRRQKALKRMAARNERKGGAL